MKIINRTVCAVLIVMMIMVPFAGCSSKSNSSQGTGTSGQQSGDTSQRKSGNYSKRDTSSGESNGTSSEISGGSGSSSQTQILGKVTSIIGNEVVLAIGTQSSNTSSSELTLTGESKTLLIPVGLTLSSGASRISGASGTESGAGAAAGGGTPPTGNAPTGAATTGTSGTRTSGTARTSTTSRYGTSSKSSSSTITTKTGFSSITAGEILRITQRTIDGTLTVVKVSVVSKSS